MTDDVPDQVMGNASEISDSSASEISKVSESSDVSVVSDAASATIQDPAYEDWSYFENSYQITNPVQNAFSLHSSESYALSCSERGWHTSDYASTTSSERGDSEQGDAGVKTSLTDENDPSFSSEDNETTLVGLPQVHSRHQNNLTGSASESVAASSPATSLETHNDIAKAAEGLEDLIKIQSVIDAQITEISDLQNHIGLITKTKALLTLEKTLSTPINGTSPLENVNRTFAEENLPPYDAASVTAKLDELHRLMQKIAQGCSEYDKTRYFLASEQWSNEQAMEWWEERWGIVACNRDRRAVDYLVSTIPFQIPLVPAMQMGLTKRRPRRGQPELGMPIVVPDLHLAANEAAKTWKGHVEIKQNHLHLHIRIFGPDSLPELPKEIMQPERTRSAPSTEVTASEDLVSLRSALFADSRKSSYCGLEEEGSTSDPRISQSESGRSSAMFLMDERPPGPRLMRNKSRYFPTLPTKARQILGLNRSQSSEEGYNDV